MRLHILLAFATCAHANNLSTLRSLLPRNSNDFTDIATPKRSILMFDIGGTARMDTFSDTRQCVGTTDGCFIDFPQNYTPDSNCADINNVGRFGMSPAVTRFWFKAQGLRLGGAKLLGFLDIDFAGREFTSFGVPRMRYCYLKTTWPKKTVIIGQYLHPITPQILIPNTVGFFAGIPIFLYGQAPQITVDYHPNDFALLGTLYSQFRSTDNGPQRGLALDTPNGYDSVKYIQNSWTPGFYLGFEWRRPTITVGAGLDIHRLAPDIFVTPPTKLEPRHATEEKIPSVVGILYTTLKPNEDFAIKAAAVLGQNGYSFMSIGGYAVSCLNEQTGLRTYTNTNIANTWIDIDFTRYHEHLFPGFFLGITKTFGSPHKHIYIDPITQTPIFYGASSDLEQVMRVAPRIRGTFDHFEVGLELDYSVAWFGPMDHHGNHPHTVPQNNIRALLVTTYNF